MGSGFFLFLFVVVAIYVSISHKTKSTSSPPPIPVPAPAVSATDKIPYQMVDQWSIPNGGYGRVVVIDPKYRNETDMVRLGKQLFAETSQDRNAFVFIFDDQVAASNRKVAIEDRLSKKDLAHYDAHVIGSYMRNINTGYHAINIMLKGVDGPSKEIPLS